MIEEVILKKRLHQWWEILNSNLTAKVELDLVALRTSLRAADRCNMHMCDSIFFHIATSVLPGMPNVAPVVSMAPVAAPLPSLPAFSWASLPLPCQAGWNLLLKALLRILRIFWMILWLSGQPSDKSRALKVVLQTNDSVNWRWRTNFCSLEGFSWAQVLYLSHLLRLNLRNMAISARTEMSGCHVLELNIGLPR